MLAITGLRHWAPSSDSKSYRNLDGASEMFNLEGTLSIHNRIFCSSACVQMECTILLWSHAFADPLVTLSSAPVLSLNSNTFLPRISGANVDSATMIAIIS